MTARTKARERCRALLWQFERRERLQPSEVCTLEASLEAPEGPSRLAAGRALRVGEMLVGSGRLSKEMVDRALADQRLIGEKLGAILVRHGHLSGAELETLLEFQKRQRGELPAGTELRLGSILVAHGLATQAQVDAALECQRVSGRRLGEELIAAGDLDGRRLQEALEAQARLVATALRLALALATVLGGSPAVQPEPR